MTSDERSFTHHALTRMAQRGISREDVEYVLSHGVSIHSGGAEHVHLRDRDFPAAERRVFGHRHGIQVLLDPLGRVVLTVYKNRARDVLKQARRKVKYDRRPVRVVPGMPFS